MKRVSILGGLAVSLVALPALAQEAVYTTAEVTLESGPAPDYPPVGSLGPGTPLALYGCLDDWSWCDVSYEDVRGWVDGEALAYPYEDQRVPVAVYGPELSLPVVTFFFDDYWGRHYRDRPFFAERDRFERHPPPPPRHREAPPPLPSRAHAGEGRPGEGRPEPAVGHPEPRPIEHPAPRPQPEARPPVPQPQPAIHPVEPRPQVAPPRPEPRPQPAPHPGEEHREPPGEAPHQ